MAGATAPAFFRGLVLQRLRRLRVEPRRAYAYGEQPWAHRDRERRLVTAADQ
jgi:hypothetical protein